MSAPETHDPRFVTTRDGVTWVRRAVVEGRGLYAVDGSCTCPEYVMATLAELADHGISGSYAAALPWAALMDDEDLSDFLDELADAATTNADAETRLAEVERACGSWRLIAEAQHGHNTAPGPDAMTRAFVPVASLREPEGEHYELVHHTYRLGHDLPETGGAIDPRACKACGSLPEQWCPDCGCCHKGCYDGRVDNPCGHENASWGAS